MIPLAVALALTAALLHAVWNILLKASADPLQTSTRAVTAGVLITSPIAVAGWLLDGRPGFPASAWELVGLSSILELLYFLSLSTAYRRGELSAVYPLARGTAPLLAVCAGVAILGERLTSTEWLGVLCLLAGVWSVRPPLGGSAVLPALLTGVFIASYSAVDAAGVRLAPPWLYGWLLWIATAVLLQAWTRARRDDTAGEVIETPAVRTLVVGVLMTATYLLVLFAFSVAPLAIVAPVRESAIVLVAGWGVWRLGERTAAAARLAGAALIVAGAALVVLR